MLERFWTFAQQTAEAAVVALAVTRERLAWRPEPQELPRQPEPLSAEDRWARATGCISAAVASFERIERLQDVALGKIDAADYAMQHLLEELSAVLPITPADGSALRGLLETVGDYDYESVAEHGTFAA